MGALLKNHHLSVTGSLLVVVIGITTCVVWSRVAPDKSHKGLLMVSNISFWEIALLVQKGRLELNDIFTWKAEIFKNTRLKLITPSIDELIQSTQLPEYHKDPFI